jgi:hypothetical protein
MELWTTDTFIIGFGALERGTVRRGFILIMLITRNLLCNTNLTDANPSLQPPPASVSKLLPDEGIILNPHFAYFPSISKTSTKQPIQPPSLAHLAHLQSRRRADDASSPAP